MEAEPEHDDRLLTYLSFSRIDKYLTCPEKYRLYYVERLRPRIPAGSLVFGQTIHQALAQLFQGGEDSVAFFEKAWGDLKEAEIKFSHRDSWEKLAGTGRTLLEKFIREELPRIGQVHASEQDFELGITTLDLPFIGVIDLVADIDLKRTLIDWKTSASAYGEHEVALSDQLTAYQLAVPEAEQAALCVFVKTKEPRIDWYVSRRTGDQLAEFLRKADLVAREISARHFFKRPGDWCAWCDYLPVCLGDERTVRETLVFLS
jgi:RecB family exonuclease